MALQEFWTLCHPGCCSRLDHTRMYVRKLMQVTSSLAMCYCNKGCKQITLARICHLPLPFASHSCTSPLSLLPPTSLFSPSATGLCATLIQMIDSFDVCPTGRYTAAVSQGNLLLYDLHQLSSDLGQVRWTIYGVQTMAPFGAEVTLSNMSSGQTFSHTVRRLMWHLYRTLIATGLNGLQPLLWGPVTQRTHMCTQDQ